MKTFKQFSEEGPVAVNAAGNGSIAGLGVGPQGAPGGTKQIMNPKKPLRRRIPNVAIKVST
jgi:hypothetical protein